MSQVALKTYLKPVQFWLNQAGVSELSINRPEEIWLERMGHGGGMECHTAPQLTLSHLKTFAKLLAQYSEQRISEERPLLSATLPTGERVQVVLPPAVEVGTIGISIRKPTLMDLHLKDYGELQSLGVIHQTSIQTPTQEHKLREYYHYGQYHEFLEAAVLARQNILISAGTSTGKTTFLNACLKVIPKTERILTLEDAREVKPPQPNCLHLLASRGNQGRAQVTMQELLEAGLRLRPDRIILGELRGAEAFTYLRAINSGHPGSLTTIHADSPQLAFEQLALMVMQANLGLTRPQILEYVRSIIPIVVQLKRDAEGRRFISEIYFREGQETGKRPLCVGGLQA